ncbi:MAG: phosphoribosyltransferase [Bacteroidetes bacterium]|nr:MAG: phosphoribosyltransferase [Bacteroidota bacterium]
MSNTKILDADQIERKFQRMARQLLEAHHSEAELILMGIDGQGLVVAKRLQSILTSISPLKVRFEKIKLNKENPLSSEIKYSLDSKDISGKIIVIVDDVLNSGRTLIYAVKHVLDAGPKAVYTTVLVDRIHRSFPVRADYCGLSLSTHLKEHISVKVSKTKSKSDAVFLEL